MKKFFTFLFAFIFLTVGNSFAASVRISDELAEDALNRIEKQNSTKVQKVNRFAIKCPNCNVKNYYTAKRLQRRKLVCNHCGYYFKTGKIFNKGQKLKRYKKSGYDKARINNINY